MGGRLKAGTKLCCRADLLCLHNPHLVRESPALMFSSEQVSHWACSEAERTLSSLSSSLLWLFKRNYIDSEGHLSRANKNSEKTKVCPGLEQHKKMQCLVLMPSNCWIFCVCVFSSVWSFCLFLWHWLLAAVLPQGQSFRETWGRESMYSL